MDKDFNNYNPSFMDYNMQPNIGMDMNDLYKDPMFNPIMQYEQAYCYYRYLCMQMEYKIKCKDCGQEIYRQRFNASKINQYRCGKCGGSLVLL